MAFTYVSSEAAARVIEEGVVARSGRAKAIRADSGKAEEIRAAVSTADINAGGIEALSTMSPLKRVAQPNEIAGLVAYIVKDEAGYMTGASVTIDGGFTL